MMAGLEGKGLTATAILVVSVYIMHLYSLNPCFEFPFQGLSLQIPAT